MLLSQKVKDHIREINKHETMEKNIRPYDPPVHNSRMKEKREKTNEGKTLNLMISRKAYYARDFFFAVKRVEAMKHKGSIM